MTQATIGSTICVSGWTRTVRPSSTYTTNLKNRQLASGYAFNGDINPSDYEEDHLIALELGGAPSSEQNLWPEPHRTLNAAAPAETKDGEEASLKNAVCNGTMTLSAAQQKILSDW